MSIAIREIADYLAAIEPQSFNIGPIQQFKDYTDMVEKATLLARKYFITVPETFLKIRIEEDDLFPEHYYIKMPYKNSPILKLHNVKTIDRDMFDSYLSKFKEYHSIEVFLF